MTVKFDASIHVTKVAVVGRRLGYSLKVIVQTPDLGFQQRHAVCWFSPMVGLSFEPIIRRLFECILTIQTAIYRPYFSLSMLQSDSVDLFLNGSH